MTDFSNKTALVTGATSGLGFEASAQLAEMSYGSVTITARTQEKANDAVQALVERTGRDVFDTVVVDVASIESSRKAAADLIGRDRSYDVVLLNAGMVPNELQRTADGLEMCFAASLVGHHILATELLDAGLIEGASVVLVGSEAANNDLPKAMGMSVYDFVLGESSAFGASPAEAMTNFAKAESGPAYNGQRQYASTKAFSAWWSAAMARRHGGSTRFFTVSPGANMGTAAARNVTGPFKIMVAVMGRVGRFIGMDQPVAQGAKRYLDVVHDIDGPYTSGRTYTSRPKKMTGPIVAVDAAHLTDETRQDTALEVLDTLIG